MFRSPIIRSVLSSANNNNNRKIVIAGNITNNNNNTFLRTVTVVGNSTTRHISSYNSTPSKSSISVVPSLMTRLHYNRNNSYGILVTPQSHYRRWLNSDNNKSSSSSSPAVEDEKDEKKEEEEMVEEEIKEVKDEAKDDTELEKLKADNVDLKNQLLRSLAEQENIRSIARNDVNAAKDYAIKSFAKSVLEVSDNLDRALESVVNNEKETTTTDDKSDTFMSFIEGIELTNSGLTKAFKSKGVEVMDIATGTEEFNPEQHQALMEYADPTKTPGTIGVVMKKGYTLNGRVLRPAEVGVIKK